MEKIKHMGRKSNPRPEVKERILQTAENLFFTQGFAATGIEQIASEAGITKSLIYYYFKKKKDIVKELFSRFEKESLELKQKLSDYLAKIENKDEGPVLTQVMIETSFPFLEKWKKVIKIGLIEEIEESSKGPIFNYLEINQQLGKDLSKSKGFDFRDDPQFSTYSFFMIIVPLIGYAILGDEWTKHYGVEKRDIQEIISSTIEHLYRDYGRKI
jgi:AcrR family transcriptional regulator